MTQRALHRVADRPRNAEADFTRLDCTAARKRVRQLICLGMAEQSVADLTGWSLGDVRRACVERDRPTALVSKLVCDANE